MVVTEEYVNGPFPLCHLDFHYSNMLVDGEYNITGILNWSNVQTVPVERFAMIPGFIAPPAASVTVKHAILEFRDIFIDALEKVERERGMEGAPSEKGIGIPLCCLFASPRSEVVCRCTYSYPWRAIFDARLVLPLLYSKNATWEEFQNFYDERSA